MNEPFLAQDPGERFDIVRADGTPTGGTKERALVHRDGDWHRSLHVWVYGVGDDGPFLLFQRRGLEKDTWPGRLDATVGGHRRAGEGIGEALRETDEEIGVTVDERVARWIGRRVCVNDAEANVRDRELQDVFLLRDDRPLTGYRPHPVELAALVRFPLIPLLELFAGDAESITGDLVALGSTLSTHERFAVSDFIPTVDRYFYRVAIAVAGLLRGDDHVAV